MGENNNTFIFTYVFIKHTMKDSYETNINDQTPIDGTCWMGKLRRARCFNADFLILV